MSYLQRVETNHVLFITRWLYLQRVFLSLKRKPKTAFERIIRKRVFSSHRTLLKTSFERDYLTCIEMRFFTKKPEFFNKRAETRFFHFVFS
jgi:hypothetical protein